MTHEAWAAGFEARYGAGEFARLKELLVNPGYSFSRIATRYGVTRERVRQWHRLLMPDAPTGRQRRRLWQRERNRRDLFSDTLFRTFYQHARQHWPAEAIRPIQTVHGFSRVRALVNQRLIALRRATPRWTKERAAQVFRITTPLPPIRYVYVLLPDDTFFVLPCAILPRGGTAFRDTDASKYARYRNTFEAMKQPAHVERAG
jgi:hypothetical protein